ncbi:aconitate hydratase [Candidatus Solirubrobacter pratensis]|uniref:aconitate hydratase n=1 Tax=Candidatus Solirubrobacter pratensis TaxID=1298857 RepID=UPI00055E9D10|nr:aconitate hydratase [Candidatus Solirubrobacter pratensis]
MGQAARSVARKLLESHLLEGELEPGAEIALRIDQTLTQDATGTLVMLEFEALGVPEVRTELSAQYVDHNLIQADFRNADDHLFLRSAARRWGLWFSKPGNGVSHPVHMQRFGVPGKTLLGSDSHTCAAGSLGMLAIGTGGLDVALAMAGEPYHVKMPEIWGVRLVGELPDWVSAKDVILEMLRRHDVDGGYGRIVEYHGPGLARLSAMDRHVIANMGAELGATTTVFPSDGEVRRFLASEDREGDWVELVADAGAAYDMTDEIDLSELEPLIALPSSPGNVKPVREVAGTEISQALIGSSANPGLRDFEIAARIVEGRQTDDGVSFDVNPTSRQTLEALARSGAVATLVAAGARLNQAGCLGCIGVGQAPASGAVSLRTVPRNFPGRSGTRDDQVHLCSPETAAASALAGRITDPRELGIPYPRIEPPSEQVPNVRMLVAPDPDPERPLRRGPNIKPLPRLDPLPGAIEAPVLLALGDDVSTDEIMPAGRALSLRSNIPALAEFYFAQIDETAYERACELDGHIVVGGENYGQGSSREHGALVPAFLGLRAVIANSFARIHGQNLVNFGVAPLLFRDAADHDAIEPGDLLRIDDVHAGLRAREPFTIRNVTRDRTVMVRHDLSDRQVRVLLAGGLVNEFRARDAARR